MFILPGDICTALTASCAVICYFAITEIHKTENNSSFGQTILEKYGTIVLSLLIIAFFLPFIDLSHI